MKFKLSANDTVQQVQQKFREVFSHLSIEFYRKPHQEEQASAAKEQYLHNVFIKDITQQEKDMDIEINPLHTTADFEQYMETEHGLHIQVMRLQRGTWLQTTTSDHLSLEEQNNAGIAADTRVPLSSSDEIDYQ